MQSLGGICDRVKRVQRVWVVAWVRQLVMEQRERRGTRSRLWLGDAYLGSFQSAALQEPEGYNLSSCSTWSALGRVKGGGGGRRLHWLSLPPAKYLSCHWSEAGQWEHRDLAGGEGTEHKAPLLAPRIEQSHFKWWLPLCYI